MAALDFPNSPTMNQQYAAPNGITYQWDGAAWIVAGSAATQLWTASGTTLLPTDPTKTVTVLGDASGNSMLWGNRTVKGRLTQAPVADMATITVNRTQDDTHDDTSKPGWWMRLGADADNIQFLRSPAGTGTHGGVALAALNNVGGLSVPSVTANNDAFTIGTPAQAAKTHIANLGGGYGWGIRSNHSFAGGNLEDTTKPSWTLQQESGDILRVYRAAPTSGAPTFNSLFYILGSDGKTYCTLANNSVTGIMLAAGATVRAAQWNAAPASYNTSSPGWKAFMTTPTTLWPGGTNFLFFGVAMYYVGSVGANEIYIAFYRDGAQLTPYLHWTVSFGNGGGIFQVPVPLTCATYDNSFGAGTSHYYQVQVYVANSNGNLLTTSDAPGGLSIWNMA